MNSEDSKKIIKEHLDDEVLELMDFRNHKKYLLDNRSENVFRFTVKLLSLEFLISLMEDKRVKNVFWNPSTPPPGGSVDSISLRYKVYVEYY
tara:strand:+ start:987 stop:1262 length:276 start_codon:yes stop_codon:yes gene_type:complete